MTQPAKIKGCPHCGGAAHLNSNYSYKCHSYFVFVKCDICGAQSKIYNTDTDPTIDNWQSDSCLDAITAWNMRTKEA